MAFLFADGFDFIAGASDVTLRWDSQIGFSGPSQVTAFGVGQSGNFRLFTGGSTLTKTLPSNEGTIFVNLRMRRNGAHTGTTANSYMQLRDGATPQVTLIWDETGVLTARTGGTGGAILGTATAALNAASWDSFQIKVVVHNTAGSVEVRKNGSAPPAAPLLLLTGINTRGGTTNNYANSLQLGANGNSGGVAEDWYYDDVFVFSGAGAVPNDWTGDLRAVTQAPSATVQSQLSVFPTSTAFGQLNAGTAGLGPGPNSIHYIRVTAPLTGSVSAITVSLGSALTGKLNAALYTEASATSGALLGQATELTNPAAGLQTLTLTTPANVVRGTNYYVAVWANANTSMFGTGTGILRATQALTYTGTFPATATATATSTNSAAFVSAALGSITAQSAVGDATQDGDTSYVYGATVGAEDLYSFPSLASQGIAPVGIVGVMPFAIIRRSDSGARTASVRAKSGSTDAAAASSGSLGLSYGILQGFLTTDPDTLAPWTNAGVDALQVGVKVDA